MDFKQLKAIHKSKWDINYLKYSQFHTTVTADTFNADSDLIPALADFYGTTDSIIEKLSLNEINLLLKHILELAKTPSQFYPRILINKIEYGFIPNFKDDITTGELIDLDFYLTKQNIPMVLSILYRPIKKKQFNPFGIFGQDRYTVIDYKDVKWKPQLPFKARTKVLATKLGNLFRPKSKKKPHQTINYPNYSIVDYTKTNEELFSTINLDIADGCLSFFLTK